MGIYDREYYRDKPSFLSSISERGWVCKWLIIINVAVFVLQLATQQRAAVRFDADGFQVAPASDPVTDLFVLNTDKVLHGEVWRLLTCAFLHASLFHIFFNMLFLFWFGSDVEDLYGPKEFLSFYLAAVLFSSLAYVGWQLVDGSTAHALGASGGVTAVLVLCALHYPSRIIYFYLLPIPIWFFVLFQVAQDAFIFLGGMHTGVAVTAHLGGAAFGLLYFKMQWRLLNLWPGRLPRVRMRSRPRLRIHRADEPQPVSVANPSGPAVDEQFEAQVDAVLAKVSRHGQDSLTEGEKALLLQASAAYKKRRS